MLERQQDSEQQSDAQEGAKAAVQGFPKPLTRRVYNVLGGEGIFGRQLVNFSTRRAFRDPREI